MTKTLLYSIFGASVLLGYYNLVSRGVDPFATESAVETAPTGPAGAHTRTHGGGVFIYGGFHGGK